ncbi:MAG: hypothetical protein ACREME_02250, partial [Gemmatimonadales bacterium]
MTAWILTLVLAAAPALVPAPPPDTAVPLPDVRLLAHVTAQPPESDIASRLTAKGAVLWDPADDVALFGRNPGEPRRMASTTKMMTVLLALEAGALGEQVTVSPNA